MTTTQKYILAAIVIIAAIVIYRNYNKPVIYNKYPDFVDKGPLTPTNITPPSGTTLG